jgi:hypothetical protein
MKCPDDEIKCLLDMNLVALANASLQVIATALIVLGGQVIFEGDRLWEGIALLVAGLVSYVIYELLPPKK